jgi:hypothetical protein
MKRLDTKTLPAFLAQAPIAVLFISSDSDAVMHQAQNFALLWAQAVVAGLTSVRFAYIDGDANTEICRRFGIAELPTTLVIRGGAVVRRVECPSRLSLSALASSDLRPAAQPAMAKQHASLPDMLEAA